MTNDETQYWLMCYPDQIGGITENGIGPIHFYAEETENPSEIAYYLALMPTAPRAAGLLKLVQGRRFVGTKPIVTESGKKYDVPDYVQFDSAACVRIDAEAVVAQGLGRISDKSDSSGAKILYTHHPDLPASCVIDVVEIKLSDKSVPNYDSPRDIA